MQPINRYLDHAVLKPQLTREEARAAIRVGRDHAVRQVCVRPADIEIALEICSGTDTAVGTVLNFPHGTGHSEGKAAEARLYIALGVQEIDMVVNYGLILSGLWEDLRRDIAAVSALTRPKGVVLKAILETSELDIPSIRRATVVAAEAGADFVKTSTGFASGSATEEAVRAMIEAAAGRIGVKASGGIRDRPRAELFLGMGCGRLGVNYPSTPVICGQAAASTRPAGGY
jgi:deoxyribose-phosphate aldolase